MSFDLGQNRETGNCAVALDIHGLNDFTGILRVGDGNKAAEEQGCQDDQ